MQHVPCSGRDHNRIILEPADSRVAAVAQEATDALATGPSPRAAGVVVVDVPRSNAPGLVGLADRTHSTLRGEKFIELLNREPERRHEVFAPEIVRIALKYAQPLAPVYTGILLVPLVLPVSQAQSARFGVAFATIYRTWTLNVNGTLVMGVSVDAPPLIVKIAPATGEDAALAAHHRTGLWPHHGTRVQPGCDNPERNQS